MEEIMRDFVADMEERTELLCLVSSILDLSEKDEKELERAEERMADMFARIIYKEPFEIARKRAKAAIDSGYESDIGYLRLLPKEILSTVTDLSELRKRGRMSQKTKELLKLYYEQRREEVNRYMKKTKGFYKF